MCELMLCPKKYFDICLSDGYSSSEEKECNVMMNRSRMKKTFTSHVDLGLDRLFEEGNKNEVISLNVSTESSKSISEATNGLNIADDDVAGLTETCMICCESFPKKESATFPASCLHSFCKECLKSYLNVKITECPIVEWVCPICQLPKLTDIDSDGEYFIELELMLRTLLHPTIYELFQQKLRDRLLMNDSNFIWCVKCPSGFIKRPKQKRLICPDCGFITCSMCSLEWEDQHLGISCEKFSEWKSENDPESQQKGVEKHLEVNGIYCPKCKFRFSLSRGGCLHMTCTQCRHEFCLGCRKPFVLGMHCNLSKDCRGMNKHAHHPRNCYYYMRDKDVNELQQLLTLNGIPLQPSNVVANNAVFCPVMVQVEVVNGFEDRICNESVGHGGLCWQHYKEYMADIIYNKKLDPLPIMDLTNCFQEIRRNEVAFPERGPYDTDEIYLGMCKEVIKNKVPIQ